MGVYLLLNKENFLHTFETFSLQVYSPTHTCDVLRFQWHLNCGNRIQFGDKCWEIFCVGTASAPRVPGVRLMTGTCCWLALLQLPECISLCFPLTFSLAGFLFSCKCECVRTNRNQIKLHVISPAKRIRDMPAVLWEIEIGEHFIGRFLEIAR